MAYVEAFGSRLPLEVDPEGPPLAALVCRSVDRSPRVTHTVYREAAVPSLDAVATAMRNFGPAVAVETVVCRVLS